MRISDFIARMVTQRRPLVWCGVAVLVVVCGAILVTSLRLDSEIFNVLPGKFASVQGLKTYDHDFEQTRELTFAVVSDPQDVDKLDVATSADSALSGSEGYAMEALIEPPAVEDDERFWTVSPDPDVPGHVTPYGAETVGIVDEEEGGVILWTHQNNAARILAALRAQVDG